MATASVRLNLRDMDIFTAIERAPLTVRQLRALSVTFRGAFGSDRRLQDRLKNLTDAGLLGRFRYAAAEGCGQCYYTLTPESYHLLRGHDEALPSPGFFREVGLARQYHTMRLADFIVRTLKAAHESQLEVMEFARENSLKLENDGEHLYPDCAFSVVLPDREPFRFYVELDNSTEPLVSTRERESWLRKLRFYESLLDGSGTRFRVLGVVTKSEKRLRNLVALAGALSRNQQRSLFYGVYLPHYLQHPTPLHAPLFTDHRGLHVALLPTRALPLPKAEVAMPAQTLACLIPV